MTPAERVANDFLMRLDRFRSIATLVFDPFPISLYSIYYYDTVFYNIKIRNIQNYPHNTLVRCSPNTKV